MGNKRCVNDYGDRTYNLWDNTAQSTRITSISQIAKQLIIRDLLLQLDMWKDEIQV